MDRIQKALDKLGAKEQKLVKDILIRLQQGELLGLDTQKLKGYRDIFRVRKGNIRIIYRHNAKGLFILAIERRSEKTYRNF